MQLKYLVNIICALVIFMGMTTLLNGQTNIPKLPTTSWTAAWIAVPDEPAEEYGVYNFRKEIDLPQKPSEFVIHVSADNRYKLYVNEKLVSLGPAWGDIQHWNYETVDLALYLKSGKNIIAAKVWNEGAFKAVAQFSHRTGFFLQGASEETRILDTNESWKCIRDTSYTPLRQKVRGYYALGAGEQIDMQYRVKGWKKLSFDDNNWKQAHTIFKYLGYFSFGVVANIWNLVPSILPQMELTPQRLKSVRRTEGISINSSFPAEKAPVQIPANTRATILLDQTFLTNAYPTLILSDGKNSTVTITYAEGLFDANNIKGNRNEIAGKTIFGRHDVIISDGTDQQNFTSLSYRTYRYVELKVETQNTPLIIDDFYGVCTGYPFKRNAKLESGNKELDTILDIGWHTARLCAFETYMDTPYYEQLQYVGDTRIQVLVSLYNSGDDRLARNALNLIDYSKQPAGYTQSRYPSSLVQVIPPFSLWYIGMLYDYMMYGSHPDFIGDKLTGTRQILDYFIGQQRVDGSLNRLPHWNFTDWASEWQFGIAPYGDDGSSAIMDLQLLLALQSAIKLEEHAGKREYVALYSNAAEQLKQTIHEKYWNNSRKLFADTPEKTHYSQHANSMAILAGLVEGQQAEALGKRMLTDTTLTQATIYFKYYLHQALVKAGLGNDYLNWLDIWRKSIKMGLTTWPETSDLAQSRSDCHAWGASPNIEFFRVILGIDSDAPGFKKVKIEPYLGSIKKISGEIPHPKGTIEVSYRLEGAKWSIEVNLPKDTEGTLYWKNKNYSLKGGLNTFKL